MTLTLFKHGKLYGEWAAKGNSIIVQNGIIQAIGQARELELQLSGKEYDTVDWEDAYVLPGLADSHMHLSMHGMKLAMLDFTSATSKDEMLDMLRKRVALTPPGEWILGLNWNENAFIPVEIPTISELDAITDQHPVYLTRTCFHTFLANSEAYRRAGIGENTPDPASGAYGRNADGQLNGLIYEEASTAFTSVQPEPDYSVKKRCNPPSLSGCTTTRPDGCTHGGFAFSGQRGHHAADLQGAEGGRHCFSHASAHLSSVHGGSESERAACW